MDSAETSFCHALPGSMSMTVMVTAVAPARMLASANRSILHACIKLDICIAHVEHDSGTPRAVLWTPCRGLAAVRCLLTARYRLLTSGRVHPDSGPGSHSQKHVTTHTQAHHYPSMDSTVNASSDGSVRFGVHSAVVLVPRC
jgi:hypothetical protein